MNQINYVMGIVVWRDKVLLILKEKGPSYVIGKWNGIGGKIEPNEFSMDAMYRELLEETGIGFGTINYVVPTCILSGVHEGTDKNYSLTIYLISLKDSVDIELIREKEAIAFFDLDRLPSNVVQNLKWIIPLALDRGPYLEIKEH